MGIRQNLDSKTGQHIANLLFNLNQQYGTTLILVTHDQKLAHRCQKQIEMADGGLVSSLNHRDIQVAKS